MCIRDRIHIDIDVAQECIQKRVVRYDKDGDNHYDTISAFIKSMRGSDPDAAVYYLARMLYAGEDMKFIARRIMICAAEDVGNADPQALVVAVAAAQAAERIGLPEAQIILSQAVTYVATAPKSNCLLYTSRDDGCGIDEKRGHRSGKGLGLKLVDSLVKSSLKGTLTIESGEGTAVRFSVFH